MSERKSFKFFFPQGVDQPRKTVIYKPTEQEQQVVVAHRGGINHNGRRVSSSDFRVVRVSSFNLFEEAKRPPPQSGWAGVHTIFFEYSAVFTIG